MNPIADYADAVEHAALIEDVATSLTEIVEALHGLDAAVDAASSVPLSVWERRLGIGRSTAADWRRGRSRPSLKLLEGMADYIAHGPPLETTGRDTTGRHLPG